MRKRRHLCLAWEEGSISLLTSAAVFMLAFLCMIQTAAAESCYPMNSAQLNFGTYNPESSQHLDSVTTSDIYCAPAFNGRHVDVRVNVIGVSGQGDRRVLSNQADKDEAQFILFQDAARTIPLTDQMAIPITESIPRSKIFTLRLYGRMLARQYIGVGTYMTSLMINIDY
jgi:spore coat protein U-like protein